MAIQSFGEQPCGRRFSDAARARKEVSVMKPVVLDGIFQGLRNRFLTGDFLKCLRSPFSGDNLVRHKLKDFLEVKFVNLILDFFRWKGKFHLDKKRL